MASNYFLVGVGVGGGGGVEKEQSLISILKHNQSHQFYYFDFKLLVFAVTVCMSIIDMIAILEIINVDCYMYSYTYIYTH